MERAATTKGWEIFTIHEQAWHRAIWRVRQTTPSVQDGHSGSGWAIWKKKSLFGKYLLKCFIYVHMSVCVYVICERGECGGQKRHWIPGAGITGSCELFDVSARNRVWVFWKSCKCSLPQSHPHSLNISTCMFIERRFLLWIDGKESRR